MFHLAQVNIARAVAEPGSPVMEGFINGLVRVNGAAERAPGYVWRLQDESGDATAIRLFGDARMIINLSVWETAADLENFLYGEVHRPYLQRRREWFEPLGRPSTACWWVPIGHQPDVAEAERQITRLWEDGPSDAVFGMGDVRPPPQSAG